MKVMLYCVSAAQDGLATSASSGPAPSAGPLQPVTSHDLTAWVGPPPTNLESTEAALAFGRVIEAYHERMTVIPMRYGCLFDGPGALAAHLATHQDRYRALLAELEACAELSLRIPVAGAAARADAPVQSSAATTSGRAYLLQRRRALSAEQAAVRQAEALDRPLAGLFRRRAIESGSFAGQAMVSVHYLVPRGQVEQLSEALRVVLADGTACPVSGPWRLSGPWPPYHFAALADLSSEK